VRISAAANQSRPAHRSAAATPWLERAASGCPGRSGGPAGESETTARRPERDGRNRSSVSTRSARAGPEVGRGMARCPAQSARSRGRAPSSLSRRVSGSRPATAFRAGAARLGQAATQSFSAAVRAVPREPTGAVRVKAPGQDTPGPSRAGGLRSSTVASSHRGTRSKCDVLTARSWAIKTSTTRPRPGGCAAATDLTTPKVKRKLSACVKSMRRH
jgi:hypothetical protein